MIRVMSLCLISMCVLVCASDDQPVASAENNPQFHSKLLEIAQTYSTFGRVDDQSRWAPALCRAPPNPSVARFSASKDEQTHGRKIYFLFAKDRHSYLRHKDVDGQFVVKESWVPKEAAAGAKAERIWKELPNDNGKMASDCHIPYVEKDGKLFHAESKSALFIMYKLDPKTPGTDAGWVYGTVSADGKQVMSAGTVSSCIKCHQDAPHGRLFGLPQEKNRMKEP